MRKGWEVYFFWVVICISCSFDPIIKKRRGCESVERVLDEVDANDVGRFALFALSLLFVLFAIFLPDFAARFANALQSSIHQLLYSHHDGGQTQGLSSGCYRR